MSFDVTCVLTKVHDFCNIHRESKKTVPLYIRS